MSEINTLLKIGISYVNMLLKKGFNIDEFNGSHSRIMGLLKLIFEDFNLYTNNKDDYIYLQYSLLKLDLQKIIDFIIDHY